MTSLFLFPQIRADVDGEVNNMEEIEAWRQRDVDARTYIYSTIKLEQQVSLHGCVTAREMWTRVQTQYAEVAAENTHLLMARFFEYKYQPGQSVMAFIASIEQMAAQLRDLESPVTDVQVMAKIIMSLPPSFRTFISAWDSVPTADKTITHLTSRLIKEEKLTLMYNKGAVDPSDSAFFTGSVNNTRQAEVVNNNNRLSDYSGQNNYSGINFLLLYVYGIILLWTLFRHTRRKTRKL